MPRAVRSRELKDKDANRRRILQVLGSSDMRAGDVARRFEISRPAVSRHLRILHEAGLLDVRKTGRERFYSIRPGPLREAAARVRELDRFWEEGMRRRGAHLDEDVAPRPSGPGGPGKKTRKG